MPIPPEVLKKEALAQLERLQSHKVKGVQVYKDHTAPKPVYHEEYEQEKGSSGYYDKDIFKQLDVIDKKFGDYTVGNQPVSQDEYCGLVAAFTMMPKNSLKSKFSTEYDPTAVEAFKNMGYDQKKAEEIVVNDSTTMLVTDHMKGDLRNLQGLTLGASINPARHDTFKALDEYSRGNKKPLAEAIARGVSVAVQDNGSF